MVTTTTSCFCKKTSCECSTIKQKAEFLDELIIVVEKMIREIKQAQNAGPGWYTRGKDGMHQRVWDYIEIVGEAIERVKKI